MYKLAIIFTLKELGYRNKVIEDIFSLSTLPSTLAKTSLLLQTMGDRSVETLGCKIRFSCVMETFPHHTTKQRSFLYFV